jgi:beta-lactamase class A
VAQRATSLLALAAIIAALSPAGYAADRPATGLRATIEGLIRDAGAEAVAVAFRDLATGDEVLIRPDDVFHAASTMKVAVLAEVYRQAEAGTLALDDCIALKKEFVSIADGRKYDLDPADDSELTLYRRLGQRERVGELARLMITESSNLATNLLIERVTARKVDELMRALGAPGVRVLRGVEDGAAYRRGMNNTTTARDLMRLMSRIADRSAVSPAASDAMLALLLQQKFHEGIPAGLPCGLPVAHKTGSFPGTYHDAAIVMPPGRRPYVLVVLTVGLLDKSKAHRLVADITRAVHARATAR